MAPTKNPLIAVKSVPGRFEPFAKAGRAEHFIIMLGDTLPAEESAALRTAGHCLAKHMIQTTLVSEVRHSYLANFAFLPNLIFKSMKSPGIPRNSAPLIEKRSKLSFNGLSQGERREMDLSISH